MRKVVKIPNKKTVKNWDTTNMRVNGVIIVFLQAHIKNKHEGYLFSCNQCDFKNARNDAVNEHIARIHDGVVYRCERCDLVMTSKGSLKSHNYTHHSDKKFQCDKCNYKCANSAILNKHKIFFNYLSTHFNF